MKKCRLHSFFHSVFTKLLMVLLITGICINLIAAGIFWAYRTISDQPFHQNIIIQYIDYIARDIGSPPSLERAKEIAVPSNIRIYYEGIDENWSTTKDSLDFDSIHFQPTDHSGVRLAVKHGRYYVGYDVEDGLLLFELTGNEEKRPLFLWMHFLLIIFLTMIILAAYFLLRKILTPIKWLDIGVKKVGQGDMTHSIPVLHEDEFGALAESFNVMTSRIREMFTAKEHLLRDMSHELRSPLTRMRVSLEFLQDNETKDDLLDDIKEMEAMITSILETAKAHHAQGRLELEDVDLASFLVEIVAPYQGRSPGVELGKMDLSVCCSIDRKRLATVINNILDNACKYSSVDSQPVSISMNRQCGQAVILIRDTGVGIAEQDLLLIMEPFYRADKSRNKATGGYGLGLSLCKSIMEAHGGKIAIQSTLGEGTTVTLMLPVIA